MARLVFPKQSESFWVCRIAPRGVPIRGAFACVAATTLTSRKHFPRIGYRLSSSEPRMKFLGYAYRFVSNFVFLALVYYSLNLIEKNPLRAVFAGMILVCAGMHSASA